MLGREAEFLVQLLIVGRSTEMLKADALAEISDVLPPAQRDARLDADPGPDAGRQDRFPVIGVLLLEPLDARHRYHPGPDALLLQLLPGRQGDLDLAAGADEDDIGGIARRVGEHVA